MGYWLLWICTMFQILIFLCFYHLFNICILMIFLNHCQIIFVSLVFILPKKFELYSSFIRLLLFASHDSLRFNCVIIWFKELFRRLTKLFIWIRSFSYWFQIFCLSNWIGFDRSWFFFNFAFQSIHRPFILEQFLYKFRLIYL